MSVLPYLRSALTLGERILGTSSLQTVPVRFASKKTGSSTRNQGKGNSKPKHRGWKRQDGQHVTQGTRLALQRKTRFHPGLNVGFGRDGTLYAMRDGKVVITCEKIDPNWDRTWVQRNYAGREDQTIYKKFFNVIAEKQPQNFRLVEEV
ncbi:large ribosomal subunit protein bL27 [Phlebotomus argentipes]|uniref:large ribosomal subunit protein bL27 n=1 Tax=Phlebotomus argentipes TaxID=94469 RepID=UPI0028932439|nr:large ribosomal subunit protein bL27 [Phlebotomus argentipes]